MIKAALLGCASCILDLVVVAFFLAEAYGVGSFPSKFGGNKAGIYAAGEEGSYFYICYFVGFYGILYNVIYGFQPFSLGFSCFRL